MSRNMKNTTNDIFNALINYVEMSKENVDRIKQVERWFLLPETLDKSIFQVIANGIVGVKQELSALEINKECMKTVKGWLMKSGNLTVTSMLDIFRMNNPWLKIAECVRMVADLNQKELAQLNRPLNKISK